MKTRFLTIIFFSFTIIFCHAQAPNIILADFEQANYGTWTVSGTAFGSVPAQGKIGNQQEVNGYVGNGLVNSFNGGDGPTGSLTSPEFKIERNYISFYIGGGAHLEQTGINLLINNQIIRTATGNNNERMDQQEWDVSEYKGQSAKIQIIDKVTGGWGHINIDHITMRDQSESLVYQKFENLRIWKRYWEYQSLQNNITFSTPLHFRFIPTNRSYLTGGFEAVNGTDKDILASGYDCTLDLVPDQATKIVVNICNTEITWTKGNQQLNNQIPLPIHKGMIRIRILADNDSIRICGPDSVLGVIQQPVASISNPTLKITAVGGAVQLNRLELYGLRSTGFTTDEALLVSQAQTDNRVFYQSKSYTVYGGSIEDQVYGPPGAYVPDSVTIVSPTRVAESFSGDLDVWLPRPLGRVIDHQTIWHPDASITRFPSIKTGWPTVDAACNVALDVLQRCGDGEFANNSTENGLWEAGFFWGTGNGFGIWLRDATHTALRSGNLIDPDVAAKTLAYTARGGIDNGVDGVAMPMIGLWDNYLVTGNVKSISNSWSNLKLQIAKLDAQFDSSAGLIKAAHSTSNDNFAEPEAGGFALGTETYFMLAYRAMAEMGAMMNEPQSTIAAWNARAQLLTTNIRTKYWKSTPGFFTTGPLGSTGYTNNNWESSGQEMAIWPRFGIASSEQRRKVLENLPKVAMNEFGVDVFPYRAETNHFCKAGWVAWTAGMAAAAGREGRLDILEQLIGQQVRNAVMNKTFFEVVDHKSGRAWRWPGQLWQATGFLSYFYLGVLGIEYNQNGLTFYPAVPQSLKDMEVRNFRYRNATLHIKIKGWGTTGFITLDGQRIDTIPANLEGKHSIVLNMNGSTENISVPDGRSIKIYPVPAKDIIHLNGAKDCKNIALYDVRGRFIQDIDSSGAEINISGLTKGVYMIKAQHEDGNIFTNRIIKI